jgi:hypothetical protein
MPAECALDTDDLPSYSHSTPYDLREWRLREPTPSKRSCHDIWGVQRAFARGASNTFEMASRGRDLTERLDRALRAEIERAQASIRNIEDEDADVPVFSAQALDRAIAFLRAQSAQFRKMLGTLPPVPNIDPGPDGSVDLHWRREGWELLVNIPPDENRLASFYGDDYGAQKIKGSFDPQNANNGILMWLTNS